MVIDMLLSKNFYNNYSNIQNIYTSKGKHFELYPFNFILANRRFE